MSRRPEADPDALACPSCALRHPLEDRFCSACGMPLVHAGPEPAERADEARERARKIDPRFADGALVRVAGGRHQAEAELIQGMLLEEGVPSILRRSAGFDVPDFLAAGPRDVLVPEAGVELARGLLTGVGMAPTEQTQIGDSEYARHAARLGAIVLGGGLLTALVAWGLLQLAG